MYLAIVEMNGEVVFVKGCDSYDDTIDTLIDTLSLDSLDAMRLRDTGSILAESVPNKAVWCYVDYTFCE